MSKGDDTQLKLLEQIRNLLALQLLKSKAASNDEISKALGITAGRASQIFSRIIQKGKGKKSGKRKKPAK